MCKEVKMDCINFEKILDNTIIGIEMGYDHNGNLEKQIHYYAYSYANETNDGFAFVEYTLFIDSLSEVLSIGIKQYENNKQEYIKQYIEDVSKEKLVQYYNHYDDGKCPILINESQIDNTIPCGIYVLT